MKINKIPPLEHEFTEVLKMLALIPKMLYFYGKLPKMCDFSYPCNAYAGCKKSLIFGSDFRPARPKCVAIVGSRKNTSYGEEVTYRAAYEAAKAGAIVISGLAYGIDSIAHRAALDAGGITIAVLGTPIDKIYPSTHLNLAREIIDRGGAIISEYGPEDIASGGKQMKARFLERNRIIAGLADVVLVTEAATKSGSLNTAMHALDTGKDLMAVPADITRENSKGCNKLITQGAIPYTEPDDLLNLLFPSRLYHKTKNDRTTMLKLISRFAETEVECQILQAVIDGNRDGDDIIREAKITASDFARAISILEIKGVVKSLGANQWILTVN